MKAAKKKLRRKEERKLGSAQQRVFETVSSHREADDEKKEERECPRWERRTQLRGREGQRTSYIQKLPKNIVSKKVGRMKGGVDGWSFR